MHANESSGGDIRLWQNTYAYAFGSPPYWLAGSTTAAAASSSASEEASEVASPEPALTSSENVPAPSELGSPNFQPLARGKLPAFQLAIQSSAFSRPSPAAVEPSCFFSRFGSSPDPADAASSGDARVQVARREGGAAARSAERAARAGAVPRAETHAGGQRHRAAISERRAGRRGMKFILGTPFGVAELLSQLGLGRRPDVEIRERPERSRAALVGD